MKFARNSPFRSDVVKIARPLLIASARAENPSPGPSCSTSFWASSGLTSVDWWHPSFDGKSTVTRTFRGVKFASEGVTYNLSEWRTLDWEPLKADGLEYHITFTFKNDGFIRDVFEERVTRAEVTVANSKQFMTMKKDVRSIFATSKNKKFISAKFLS